MRVFGSKKSTIEMAVKALEEVKKAGTIPGGSNMCSFWEGVLQGAAAQLDEDFTKTMDAYLTMLVKTEKAENEKIKVVLDEGATMPAYAHDDDAGMDLISSEINVVPAHDRQTFKTGVHMAIPNGYFGAIRAKSGLLRKHGIICSGTVDCSYTGEIMVTLVNTSDTDYQVFKGDKIAQMILIPYHHAEFVQVDKLDETERGDNGFGSTGR